MGANFIEKATTRVARSISFLDKLSDDFDAQTGISPPTTAHTTKDDKKDVHHIATIVLKNKLLDTVASRCHSNFPKMSNPLYRLDWEKNKGMDQKRSDCTEKVPTIIRGRHFG